MEERTCYSVPNPYFLSDRFVYARHKKLGTVYIKLNSSEEIEEIGVDIGKRMHNTPLDKIKELRGWREANVIEQAIIEHIGEEYWHRVYKSSKQDYMKLSKERFAESLVEREKKLHQTIVPITTKWHDAQGDHLPPYDKEVIVLIQDHEDDPDHLRVAYGHRPNPNGYVNKDGERLYPMTYGIGGWNVKNVKYWLDVELPIKGY